MEDARVNAASFLAGIAVFALLIVATGCGMKAAKQAVSPPVQNLTAVLEDEVHDLPHGEIRWTTYWRLCWDGFEGASEYELQVLTPEGASPKLQRQSERCLRLEVAGGKNPKTNGLLNRDLQLAIRSSEVSYRVRAVLAGGRSSEWSRPLSVGKPIAGDAQ